MFIFSKCYLVIFFILFAYLFFIVLLAFLIYYVLLEWITCMYHISCYIYIYITYRFINQENIFFHERKLIINEENKLFYERKLIKSCFTNSIHH